MKPVDVLANVVASPISTNPSLRTTTLYPLSLYYADFLVSFSPVSTRILSSQPTVPLTHPLDAFYPRGFSPLQPDSSISQSSKGYRFYEPPRCACMLHTATVSGRVAGSTRDFTDVLVRTRNVEFRGVARVTTYSLAIFNDAEESFHSNLTGMHVCTCREYKARENLSLVALASAIPELRSCAMAAPSNFAAWK